MPIKIVPKPKRKPPIPKKKKKNKIVISKEMGEDYTKTPVEKPIKKMGGGYMKKDMMGGGYMKKNMAKGGSLEMVEKNGKKVPFYAADGVGKMAKGGQVYKRGHGGKVIKNNMGGQDLVNACYDN